MSSLDGSQLHAPVVLPPGNNPGTHRIESWVDPRADLDVFEKIKSSCLYRDSNPGRSSSWPIHYMDRLGCSGSQLNVEPSVERENRFTGACCLHPQVIRCPESGVSNFIPCVIYRPYLACKDEAFVESRKNGRAIQSSYGIRNGKEVKVEKMNPSVR